MKIFLLTVYALAHREVVRFYRQRNRVIGALAAPIMFWFLIGSGMGGAFKYATPQGAQKLNYLQYFFPGTLLMMILFTAIFSSISIIEDRREGFLQSVMIAPGDAAALAMGKITGAALLAWMQAVLFLPAAFFLHLPLAWGSLGALLILLFVTSLALAGLGFFIAWKMDSVQGFHAIMNLLLMPMWFLSGSLFPVHSAPRWLRWVMLSNPLTYALRALSDILLLGASNAGRALNWGVIICFAALMFAASSWICARKKI